MTTKSELFIYKDGKIYNHMFKHHDGKPNDVIPYLREVVKRSGRDIDKAIQILNKNREEMSSEAVEIQHGDTAYFYVMNYDETYCTIWYYSVYDKHEGKFDSCVECRPDYLDFKFNYICNCRMLLDDKIEEEPEKRSLEEMLNHIQTELDAIIKLIKEKDL